MTQVDTHSRKTRERGRETESERERERESSGRGRGRGGRRGDRVLLVALACAHGTERYVMVWRWGVAHTRRQLQLVALKNRECPRKCKKEFTWKIHDSRTRYNTSTTPLSSITMQPCSLSKEYTYDRWSGCDRGAVRAPNKSRDMHLSIKYFTRRNHEKYNL